MKTFRFDPNTSCEICNRPGAVDIYGDFVCEDCMQKSEETVVSTVVTGVDFIENDAILTVTTKNGQHQIFFQFDPAIGPTVDEAMRYIVNEINTKSFEGLE